MARLSKEGRRGVDLLADELLQVNMKFGFEYLKEFLRAEVTSSNTVGDCYFRTIATPDAYVQIGAARAIVRHPDIVYPVFLTLALPSMPGQPQDSTIGLITRKEDFMYFGHRGQPVPGSNLFVAHVMQNCENGKYEALASILSEKELERYASTHAKPIATHK